RIARTARSHQAMEARRMMLDRNSVNAGYAAAMKRMRIELQQFKQESASAFFELRCELDAALEQVRATRLEFLNYKASVTHDRQISAAYPIRSTDHATAVNEFTRRVCPPSAGVGRCCALSGTRDAKRVAPRARDRTSPSGRARPGSTAAMTPKSED